MKPFEIHTDEYHVSVRPEQKEIFVRNLKDVWNETCAYNRAKRPFSKAYKALEGLKVVEQQDKSTFNMVREMLERLGMKMHTYCAID